MALAFRRENNLDAMRLALAVIVIFSHSFQLASASYRREPLFWLSGGRLDSGAMAVNAFFAISGYLITMSLARNAHGLTFVRRRAARLLPGYLVALTFSALVASPLGGSPVTSQTIRPFAASAVGLTTWVRPDAFLSNPMPRAVNGSLWTVHYEAVCYAGTLALGYGGLLRRRRLALAVFCLVLAVAGAQALAGQPGTPARAAAVAARLGDKPRLFAYYLAGTVAYLWSDRIPAGRIAMCAYAAIAAATLALPKVAIAVALPPALAVLLLRLAFSPRVGLERFARWTCGDYSYGTYLYAFPIQQLLARYVTGIGPMAMFAIAAPVALAFGAASWHGVERWFLPRARVAATERAAPRVPGVDAA